MKALTLENNYQLKQSKKTGAGMASVGTSVLHFNPCVFLLQPVSPRQLTDIHLNKQKHLKHTSDCHAVYVSQLKVGLK